MKTDMLAPASIPAPVLPYLFNLNAKYARALPDRIIRNMRDNPVPWGPVGYVVYKRTYARRLDEGSEELWQTLTRCINGLLDIGGAFTLRELEILAHYTINLKAMFSGRHLWQLGTHNVERFGGDSLQACWHVRVNEPITPFTFAFDELMLGGGVGFNIMPENVYEIPNVRFAPEIRRVPNYDCDFIVPDNREGYVELARKVLHAHFFGGGRLHYNTDCVREKGKPIQTFGGTASGSEDLVSGMDLIVRILRSRLGQKLRPIDCMDIMNIIGMIVVAGNTRRSAQIACGSGRDVDFLLAKYWGDGAIIPKWRSNSNNTVVETHLENLLPEFWKGYEADENGNAKGEPYGLFNPYLAANFGRLIDGERHGYNSRVCGPNPCVVDSTWVHTSEGPRQVKALLGQPFIAMVHGETYPSTKAGFFYSGHKPTYRLTTTHGYSLTCTEDHEVYVPGGRTPLKDLKPGDTVILHNHSNRVEWGGAGSYDEGFEAAENYEVAPDETASSNYYRGFLTGLIAAHAKPIGDTQFKFVVPALPTIQRMFARYGIMSLNTGNALLVDSEHATKQLEIFTTREDVPVSTYTTTVRGIDSMGVQPVYDCQITTAHNFDANGIQIANCGEVMLEDHEACNLGELFMTNLENETEFHIAAELMTKVLKTISGLPFINAQTNKVVSRNRRLGLGVTGVMSAHHLRKPPIFNSVYKHIRETDKEYSALLNCPESIALTTVKPSGTLSKLAKGCPPGGNPAYALHHLLRIEFAEDSPMIATLRDAGYPVEPKLNLDGSRNFNSYMVSFPVGYPDGTPSQDISAIDQLENVKMLQTYWSDNAVSSTIQFHQEELPAIRQWLTDNYTDSLKTVAFCRHTGHGFVQPPNEPITRQQYEKFVASVHPIGELSGNDDMIDGLECGTGGCPTR